MQELDISIQLQEGGYMVENHGVYYKLGQWEGKILERLVNREPRDVVMKEENLSEEQLDQFMESLTKHGVIGKQKEKKNILFYRIPLLQADTMFEKNVKIIKKNIVLVKVLLILAAAVTLWGLALMGRNLDQIFSFSTLKLPWYQYVALYIGFLFTVCMHEMAHGTVCKYVGGKVGTIGLMLILFSPAMYCDISGIRMVEDRRKQVLASSAGLMVNIFFLSIASIGFAINKNAFLGAFIILEFTTILSNMIPFIRLDGYWILSFATGITNLYKKSLHSIPKLFQKSTKVEKFIAIYGMMTYAMLIFALGSAALTVFNGLKYVIQIII